MVTKKENKKGKRGALPTIIILCVLVIAGLTYYFGFTGMSRDGKERYIYIDNDDTEDSVYNKIEAVATRHSAWALRQVAEVISYGDGIRGGRYAIGNAGAIQTLRNLRNGRQAPIHLTIQSVRTLGNLAEAVSKKLSFTQEDFMEAVSNPDTCAKYGYTPETIIGMFVPNTYDFYWNTTVSEFLHKMQKECGRFWTMERKEKAKVAGLTPEQVTTMASIVDEETANDDEKPMIAGMYYNRLKANMPLQADPTIKFALGDFSIKRIYHNMLTVDSPYNTYKNKGLPPGPIRIPTVAGIDAVLNYVHHDYMYMCAKEDFSGKHNFARTYEEHLKNAEKYSKALNDNGIK